MAKTYKTGVVYTGDASGAVNATKLTRKQLALLNNDTKKTGVEFQDLAKKTAAWAAVAAGTAVAGATVLVKKQLDIIDSTAKTSDKLGIATEKLTAMRIQAELTGVASNTLDMGLQRMVRRVAEAAQGTGEAAGALAELGINAQALNRLSPDEQFNAIADAMANVEGQSDKVRLAFKLFDSEGVALVNTLKGGSAAALEAQQFTEQWGLALTRVDAAKIEQANDAMTLLSTASEGFWKQLTVKVSPAIAGLSGEILGMGEDFGTAGDQAQAAFEKIAGGAAFVANGIDGIGRTVTVITSAMIAGFAQLSASVDATLLGIVRGLDAIPGLDFSEEITEFEQSAKESVRVANMAMKNIGETMERQLAGDKLLEKLRQWGEEADNNAKKVADSVDVATGAYDKNNVALDSLLISKDKLNRKLDEETAKALAVAEAYGNTIGAMEQENAWLQRELQAIQNGEAALRAFNKEKAVELALRNENVYKLQPEEIAHYKELIEQNYDLQQEIGDLTDKQNDFQAAVDRGLERLDDSFFDFYKNMVLDGKASFDDLKDVAINALLEITYAYARADLFSALNLPGSSGGAGGGGGGSGSLSDLFSLSSLSNLLGSTPLAGLGDLVTNAGMNMGSRTIHGIGKNLQNMSAMDIGLSALAAYAGDYLGSEVGKALFGKEAESSIATTIGGIGGTLLGGPLGSLIGSTLGRIIDTAFGGDGYKRQAVGASVAPVMPGQQSTGYAVYGASGLTYQGLTEGSGDAELANQYADVLASTDTAITSLASMLSGRNLAGRLEGQALPGSNSQGAWGPNFFGSLDGSSLDDALESFEGRLAQRITKLTGTVLDLDAIRAMGKEGEALGDTIYRVQGELITVNGLFDAMGIKTLAFSTAGLAAADNLVNAAGGLDALVSATDYYYQNVYSETERAQKLYDQHSTTIADFNDTYGTAIESTDDLRAYVDQLTTSQNWGSEATQAAYIAALQLTPTLVAQKQAMDLLAPAVEEVTNTVTDAVEELLSAGQINTLTDISRTIFDAYENREDSIKDLQDELADIDAEIAELTSNASDGFETVADTIDGVTNSVQSLSTSSSELRSQADAIRNTIASLSLGASTYLNNTEQLNFAEQQFEEAKRIYESTNDSSALNSAASAYAAELAQYHSGNATGRAKFDAMLEYMQSVGVELDGQASAAERAEAIAQASQSSLENIDSTQSQLLNDINNNDRLDALYQQRQTIAAELAQLTATESKGILETKLQALVDSTPAIDSLPGLLETLPQDIADALGGILAISPEQYGSNSELVNQLFNTVLNRDPSSSETDYWQTYLDNAGTGQTVSDFFDQFGNGSYQDAISEGDILEQFNDVFDSISPVITDFFDSVLGRAPALEGAEFWQNVLDTQGLNKTVEEMYATLSREGINPLITQDEFLNSYDVGTPFVTHDQTANIHRGEIIVDPQSSDILRKYGINVSGNNNAEIVAKLDQIVSRLESLENTTGTGVQMQLNQGREQLNATREQPAEIARQINPVKVGA